MLFLLAVSFPLAPGKPKENPGRGAGAQQDPLKAACPIGNRKESPSSRFLNLHGERPVPDESSGAAGQTDRHRPRDGNKETAAVSEALRAPGLDGDHGPNSIAVCLASCG